MSEIDPKNVSELMDLVARVEGYNTRWPGQIKLTVPDGSPMLEYLKDCANGSGLMLTGAVQFGKGVLGATYDGGAWTIGHLGTAKNSISKLGGWFKARGAQPITGDTKDDSKDS